MAKVEDILRRMRTVPHDVPFAVVAKVCEHYFGTPRQRGTSHAVYRTPWPGDPRVNIQQGKNGKAKGYKVKQVVQAIERLLVQERQEDNDAE
ncbi:hypothetical protein [Azospirillum soli]|uniref:hypothetical protein n=1 Tax=Azospirillum soli TaxID=1304799 RepID=UPI001AEA76D1|nr:hypothetical protein [Azospirillum soli]MBP2316124.1 hypothetical protein [Azospirillum soli]